MAESDGPVDLLKDIRDEIRGVRAELREEMRSLRMATGVRTAVMDRSPRWRAVAVVSLGALAVVAVALAVRGGGESTPATVVVEPKVALAPPPAAPPPLAIAPAPVTPAPVAMPALRAPAAAPQVHPDVRPELASASAVAAPARRRVIPSATVKNPVAPSLDEDTPIALSPPGRRARRAHTMSYGPVDAEPAKL